MAEENEEEKQKSPLVKYLIFAFGGAFLIVAGLGIGYFMFGSSSQDPNEVVDKVIAEREAAQKKNKADNGEGEAKQDENCVETADGKLDCGPKKISKTSVKEKVYKTLYFQIPGNLTTNLKGSTKFLQIEVGVSTQYDEEIIKNVEAHLPALKAEMLATLSDYSEDQVFGRAGRIALADTLKKVMNEKLKELEGFGGVEGVHLTGFVMQ